MSGSSEGAPIGVLVLARALVAGDKGATSTDLKKALEPLFGHRWAGAELAGRLAQALDELDAAGLIVRTRKGKTERGTLTPEGSRRALEFLGLDELPPRATWGQLIKSSLAARALGLDTPRGKAAKAFAGEPGFQAALLKNQFHLPLDDHPTFDQALDALAWTLLGFEPGAKFALKAVKAALIRRALDGGGPIDPKADPKKEAARLLARKVGALKSGADGLRQATIRRWLDGDVPAPAVPAAASPPELDLDTFARRVREAARSSPTGRFGDSKVFVVHVWRALGAADPAFAAMGLEDFKRRLGEANNARKLDLRRADMVEAMDAEDVRLSTVSYHGAEFHFVLI